MENVLGIARALGSIAGDLTSLAHLFVFTALALSGKPSTPCLTTPIRGIMGPSKCWRVLTEDNPLRRHVRVFARLCG